MPTDGSADRGGPPEDMRNMGDEPALGEETSTEVDNGGATMVPVSTDGQRKNEAALREGQRSVWSAKIAEEELQEMVEGTKYTWEEFYNWSETRQRLSNIVNDPKFKFETCMGLIILFNVILMVIEVDSAANCDAEVKLECSPAWAEWANIVLLLIYTGEVSLHVYIDRSRYFLMPWNVLDFVIVVFGYLEVVFALVFDPEAVEGLAFIRLLRLGRVLRAVKLFKPIPELYKLVVGFLATMKAIFWGFVMILCLLAMFAILTMQVVQPYRDTNDPDDWCNVAFSSTIRTVLFFFQTLVAGDSWGTCVIPMVLESWVLFAVFSAALTTVQLGFTNLILSVIVDTAATTRDENMKQKMKEQRKKESEDAQQLYDTMARIDADGSGTLTLQELLTGYDEDAGTQEKLLALGIDRPELEFLFHEMDYDESSVLSYSDFVETIIKAETQDNRMQLMMLKLQMKKISYMVSHQLTSQLTNVESNIQLLLRGGCLPTVSQEQSGVEKLLGDTQEILEPKEVKFGAAPKDIDNVASGVMVQLEKEMRSMGVDLQGRLEALARDAEVHMASIVKHSRRLSQRLSQEASQMGGGAPTPPNSAPVFGWVPKEATSSGRELSFAPAQEDERDNSGGASYDGRMQSSQSISRRIGPERIKYQM
eukprot:TRINITY_DN49191_c0_g1_i1.p1 TRINITY_DN49191_c0_g1~~TRINITY_DN49191_c0_g1_i1.p1  ORF type:complete len:650 (-),score=134.60 TRINITY_DN49191_c0_g1_i1:106-2055(-)